MRKFLTSLPTETLTKIALDYSMGALPRRDQITGLCKYFASYGLRVSDVKSRYLL